MKGLLTCPLCGDDLPEITSGDGVLCSNEKCLCSASFDAWQNRVVDKELLAAAIFFYQAAAGYPDDMPQWATHIGVLAKRQAANKPG